MQIFIYSDWEKQNNRWLYFLYVKTLYVGKFAVYLQYETMIVKINNNLKYILDKMSEKITLNVNTSADAIRRQREAIQANKDSQQFKKKVEFDEKNYLNLRLNKGETTRKVTVRILPVSVDDPNTFLILHTHSMKVSNEISKSGYKSFICLNEEKLSNHDGRGCPLCQKSAELLKQSNAIPNDDAHKEERKALFKQGMQYKAKETFIVRVIERGHEDEGVKFWRFNAHNDGTGIYDQLMSIFDNRAQESVDTDDAFYKIITNQNTGEVNYEKVEKDEYDELSDNERTIIPYNVFDLNNGKDFIITLQYVPTTEKTTLTISDAGKETPLSKDVNKAMSWVNDEKTWADLYSLKPYEYLELVSVGKVPYFDKEAQKWVDKATVSNDDIAAAEARKILENSTETEPINTELQLENEQDNGDDLPF